MPVVSKATPLEKVTKGVANVFTIGRSHSSPDLRQPGGTSLQEICQRGGCDTLKLPAEFSPTKSLLIPCSLAAMGSYIVEKGEYPLKAFP